MYQGSANETYTNTTSKYFSSRTTRNIARSVSCYIEKEIIYKRRRKQTQLAHDVVLTLFGRQQRRVLWLSGNDTTHQRSSYLRLSSVQTQQYKNSKNPRQCSCRWLLLCHTCLLYIRWCLHMITVECIIGEWMNEWTSE